MAFLKQIALLALAAGSGLFLVGCQPSDPSSPKVAQLASIAVAPSSLGLNVGGRQSLVVIATFSDGSTRDVSFDSTFVSSANIIATVSPTGLVSAVASGTATITATHTLSGKTAATQVTVAPLRVISIAVSPANTSLAPGGTQQLVVTGRFDDATTGDVTAGSTFRSSDPLVATVSATGLVSAVAVGTATITATHTASAATATAEIEVTDAAFSGIDFDDPGVVYTLTGFGGAEDSSLAVDPADATNTVAKVVKSATAELWAGTTVSTGPNDSVGRIPFTASDTRMTVRVYSPRVGVVVLLKVEDAADKDRYVETVAVTTVAGGWETLTFDFADPAAGSPALDLTYTYNKISIFFDFGKSGADGGGGTFYFDDVLFVVSGDSGNTGTCSAPCIDFAGADVQYAAFEELVLAEQSDDPVDATNKVAKFVKGPSGQPWAGATIYTIEATQSVAAFDLTASKVVTLRVYAPQAGVTVRLKLEDATNSAVFLEQDVLTTRANAWETLSFDFTTPVGGAYDPANTYDRVSVFPAFSTTAPPATELTFYFDELQYTAVDSGGGSGPLVFASGYATGNRTVEGGEWGFYSDDFTSYANTYAGGGFVDGPAAVPAEDSYVYLVVTTSAPTTGGYMGIFTAAPGYTVAAPNAGVTLDGQSTLRLELGMAAEWFAQPSNKQLTVLLIGTEVYSDGADGTCRILLETPLTPTTADLATYTIELAGMTLAQPCNSDGFNSGVTTVAEALARPIAELHVQAVFPQVNTTVTAGAEYPTGFTRGAAWFE